MKPIKQFSLILLLFISTTILNATTSSVFDFYLSNQQHVVSFYGFNRLFKSNFTKSKENNSKNYFVNYHDHFYDLFHFNPDNPNLKNTTIATACDSHYWAETNQTYTQSGIYTVDNLGTLLTLELTITPSSDNFTSITVCDSYFWANTGTTYTSSGTYTGTTTNCVTEVLNLTITPSSENITSATACDSYFWVDNGSTYTSSGTYYGNTTNCFTEVLNLTITPSSENITSATACDSYFWINNGQTYTSSGTYFGNTANCVTDKLVVTITPSSDNVTTISSPTLYLWPNNGVTYATSGIFTGTTTDCVTEKLILSIIPTHTTTKTECASYLWPITGDTYTQSGTYSQVVNGVNEVLDLTITPLTENIINVTANNSYTWNGTTYTTSGLYVGATTNCVVDKLNLTINGAALDFDGVNDRATIINNTSLNVNQFTIETWLKLDSSSAVPVPFVCSKGYENMEIHITKSNKSLRFIPTNGILLDTDANSLPENTWVHVACVYNPNASLAKIYINGVEMNTTKTGTNPLTTPVNNNTSPLIIGSRIDFSFPFKGALDEFRVWNKALTQAEILERLNCEIPTTASGLIANLHFNQGTAGLSNTAITTITDVSGANNNATLTNFDLTGATSNFIATGGVVSNTVCNNFLATALDFDGVNDRATIANNSTLNVNQFTIETWLKWDGTSAVMAPFICANGFENKEIHIGKSNNSLRFIPIPGLYVDTNANTLMPGNWWTHIACVFNPATSLVKIYINGTEMATTVSGSTPLNTAIINSTSNFVLGSRTNGSLPFKGALDEFRIWNRALSQAEIQARMNCEIPTIACGLITNLHFNQGVAGVSNTAITSLIDSSGFSNNATLENFGLTGTISNFVATGGVVSNTSCTNISIAAPTANATQTFCGNATIASLTATGTNLLWCATATGGTALATSTTLTARTYYVSQTVNGCESTRTAVTVTITNPTAPTANATQSFCGSDTIASLTATGTNLKWYANPTGGSPLATTNALTTTTYYVSQTVNGCESAKTAVAVTITPNTENITTISACGSYTWANNNQTYTTTGVYTGTTTNCVTEKLNLTIINAVPPTNFTVNGINYVVTGTNTVAVDVTPTASGAVILPATVSSICNTYTVTSIGEFAFADCDGLTSITLPNSIISIEPNTFQSCTNLASVTLPSSITSIGAGAFNNCTSLASVTLPSSITSIGDNAFTNCYSLSSITIPNSVTNIGNSAFSYCINLTSITVSWGIPLAVIPEVFENFNAAATTLIVPPGTVATYDAAPVWTNFFNIIENCSTVTYNETTITACGSYTWASNGQTYTTSGVYTTPTFNCVANKLNLTINAVPAAPTATSPQVSNTNTTLANLDVTGNNLIWYTAATGTTILPSTTTVADGTTYYVSQTIAGCESTRTAITIRKISEATQTVCGTPTVSNLASTPTAGTTTEWFTAATGGTALPNTTALASDTYYAAQGTIGATTTVASGFGNINNIALQADGKIIMAIAGATSLSRLNADGTGLTTIGNSLTEPRAVAVEADGKILVSDAAVIKRMNADGTNIQTLFSGAGLITALAVQADGKILFADEFDLKRMNADGTGIVTLYNNVSINSIAIHTDGKIVFTLQNAGINMYRINTDGSNLESFNVTIYQNTPFSVAVQSDGKIVVAHSKSESQAVEPTLTRFNANVSSPEVLVLGYPGVYAVAVAIKSDGQIFYALNNGTLYRISNSNFSNRVPVTVNVIPQPALPIAAATQTFCDSSTVANLTATGTDIKWYATAIGGTPLATTATLTAATTYYATQTANGCESVRLPVLVEIGNLTVNAGADVTVCLSTNSTITATVPSNTNGVIANGFTGNYGLSNWIFTPATAQSSVDITSIPNTFTINGVMPRNNGLGNNFVQNNFSITAPEMVTISFDWVYNTNVFLNDANGNQLFNQNSPMYKVGQGAATALNGFAFALGGSQSGIQTLTVPANAVFTILTNINGTNGTTTLKISNFKVRGAGSLTTSTWTATNGGSFSGDAAGLSITPRTSGTYTFAATSNNGCSASDSVDVVVNSTVAPTISDPQEFCGSATIANLTATGSDLKYYRASNNQQILAGVALQSGDYFVTQTLNGCESIGSLFTVSINSIPAAPTATTTQTICVSGTIANLTATGTNLKWYTNATGGTALATTTALVNATTYYASQTTNGCESASRTAVTTTIEPPKNIVLTPTTFCSTDAIKTITSIISETTIETIGLNGDIDSNNWTVQAGGFGTVNIFPNEQFQFDGLGSQTIGSTASASITLPFDATISFDWTLSSYEFEIGNYNANAFVVVNGVATTFAPTTGRTNSGTYQVTIPANQPFSINIQHLANVFYSYYLTTYNFKLTKLPALFGGTYNWTASNGGSIVGSNANTSVNIGTSGTYQLDYTSPTGCVTTSSVAATVVTTPLPTASTSQTFCGNPTIASLSATGTNLKWYAAATGGTAIASSTTLTTATTYYVSQTIDNCESERVAVAVTLVPTPSTPIVATTQVFCTNGITIANLVATGTDIKWFANATSSFPLVATTALTTATTYYVSQNINGCESARVPVMVEINDLQVNAGADVTLCASNNSTLNATVPSNTNGVIATGFTGNYALPNWTFTGANANSFVDTTSVPNSFTINAIFTANLGGPLNNSFTLQVPETVTISFDWVFSSNTFINNFNTSTGIIFPTYVNSPMYSIGQGMAIPLDGFALASGLNQSGTQTLTVPAGSLLSILTNTIQTVGNTTLRISNFKVRGAGSLTSSTWTATNGGSFNGDATGLTITPLTSGTYTFAATSNNGCSASDSVEVVVNSTPLPTTTATQSFCVSGTIADLTATGLDIKWYATATGGTALASTETLSTATYYVSQTVDGCESLRAAVVVIIKPNTDNLTTITACDSYTWNGTTYTTSSLYIGTTTNCVTEKLNLTITQKTTYYADADGDGFGNALITQLECSQPVGYVTNNTDCNDNNTNINPIANEICDGIDNNCNGQIDEGCNNNTTQLITTTCGSVLPNIFSTIHATRVPNATGYRFRITNLTTNSVQVIDRINYYWFQFNTITDLTYNTIYKIEVMVQIAGIWQNSYGVPCSITTPSLSGTGPNAATLPTSQCGSTLVNINSSFGSNNIAGATGYRFRLTNTFNNSVQILDRPVHWLSLNMFPIFNYSVTYTVEIAIKTTGTTYSAYGSICTITTPPVPAIQNVCGTQIAKSFTNIGTKSSIAVTSYKFEITNLANNSVQTIIKPVHYFSFRELSNIAPLTLYSIRVALETGGTFSEYGLPCTVTSPVAAREINSTEATPESISEDFRILAIPNPFTDSFALDLKTSSAEKVEVKVYDMIGKLLESRAINFEDINNFSLGNNYPSGVYNMIVVQDNNVKTLRVIKR